MSPTHPTASCPPFLYSILYTPRLATLNYSPLLQPVYGGSRFYLCFAEMAFSPLTHSHGPNVYLILLAPGPLASFCETVLVSPGQVSHFLYLLWPKPALGCNCTQLSPADQASPGQIFIGPLVSGRYTQQLFVEMEEERKDNEYLPPPIPLVSFCQLECTHAFYLPKSYSYFKI